MGWGGRESQDFHALGPPFAIWVLFCRNPNFLAWTQTFQAAPAFLFDVDICSKDNVRVGNLHSAEHVVSSLNVNPAVKNRLVSGRIYNPALKCPFDCPHRDNRQREQEQNDNKTALHHRKYDADSLFRVHLS